MKCRGSILGISMVLLAGCSGGDMPDCHYQGRGHSSPSAGCLVVHHGEMLLVQIRNGKFGPPAGVVDEGELSQCAAERETFEETAVEVMAGEQYHQFPNGFRLYWCEPVGEPSPVNNHRLEIKSVGFYSLDELSGLTWRYPEQLPMFIEAVKQRQARERKSD